MNGDPIAAKVDEALHSSDPVDETQVYRERPPKKETHAGAAAGDPPLRIGRYEALRELGRGAFGTVYLARDPRLERLVALKVDAQAKQWSKDQREQFVAEARTAARLKHPNIVAMYDVDECRDHGIFIAMEYMNGGALRERIARGALSVDEAVGMMAQVADAMQYAHKQGLVHCDLKPGNILLDEDGTIKVSDFGLALWEETQRQRKGEVWGTLAYMAPEQVRGQSHHLDGRCDVWSLGVILYECLSGRRPFQSRNADDLSDEILHRDPKPLRQLDERIPKALDELCGRCLRKEPADRLPTAHDLRIDLDRFQSSQAHGPRRSGWLVAGLGGCMAAAVAVAAVIWFPKDDALPVQFGPGVATAPRHAPAAQTGNLLARPPKPLAFERGDPLNMHSYSEEQQELALRTKGWASFILGDMPAESFALSASIRLPHESEFHPVQRPLVGVFWGLRQNPDSLDKRQLLAMAVQAEPDPERRKLIVYLYHFTFEDNPFRFLYVRRSSRLGKTEIPWNAEAPLSFRLNVSSGRLETLDVQGQPIALDFWSPDRVVWERFSDGQLGVNCLGGHFAVTHAMLQPQPGDPR